MESSVLVLKRTLLAELSSQIPMRHSCDHTHSLREIARNRQKSPEIARNQLVVGIGLRIYSLAVRPTARAAAV